MPLPHLAGVAALQVDQARGAGHTGHPQLGHVLAQLRHAQGARLHHAPAEHPQGGSED